MQNTPELVVIPRDLAQTIKALLMDIEDYWQRNKDEERYQRASMLAKRFISAEKLYSRPATKAEIDDAGDLLP